MRVAIWELSVVLAFSFVASVGQPANESVSLLQSDGTQAATADGGPQFEVATIKPSDPEECCARTFGRDGRRFSANDMNLKWLIQWAYGLQAKQVIGGPPWMDQDRFDISGEIEGAKIPTDPEWTAAVRKLLEDRFQLRFHHETREMPAYVLTVARGGTKLTRSDPEKDREPVLRMGGDVGQTMRCFGRDITVGALMGQLQRLALNRPVVDRTGISGTYDIDLAFTREDADSLGMTQLPDNAAPNLITALNEQLGLKLEGAKAPVDVLVIDQAQKPSPN